VAVTVTDNETNGVTVSPTVLSIDEANGTGSYRIMLNTAPSGTVTITPESNNPAVTVLNPGPLEFTPSNWNQPQTVALTGVDDDIDNETDRSATISHTIAGGGYVGISVADVTVTATDDDTIGVNLSKNQVTVGEAGGTSTYEVVLLTEPTGPVTVTPESDDPNVATVSGPLEFTINNWNRPQTVTVTGVEDPFVNVPARSATISHGITGGGYGEVRVGDVRAIATDTSPTRL